jgi:hypothetical protein
LSIPKTTNTMEASTTTTTYDNDQFQLVPHYGPKYNQYALPAQQQWTTNQTNTNTNTTNNPPQTTPTSEPPLNHQPPPLYPDEQSYRVVFESLPDLQQQPTSSSQATTHVHADQYQYPVAPDLLSDDPIPEQQQQQQQQQRVPTEVTFVPEQTVLVSTTDDIPPEVVASQMRALAEIQQHHQEQQRSLTLCASSSSQALVVVPTSANPIGSDAIHPQKYQMKARRQRRTAGIAVGGAVVGGLTLGPASDEPNANGNRIVINEGLKNSNKYYSIEKERRLRKSQNGKNKLKV